MQVESNPQENDGVVFFFTYLVLLGQVPAQLIGLFVFVLEKSHEQSGENGVVAVGGHPPLGGLFLLGVPGLVDFHLCFEFRNLFDY